MEQGVEISRVLAHALRHRPEEYGLQLDAQGWANVASLVRALGARRSSWAGLDEVRLRWIVEQWGGGRYEMESGLIRARYGHSVPVSLEYEPTPPPETLFHGTPEEALDSIFRQGLRPMARQRVHLGVDREEARRVGQRRVANPAILRVRAREAYEGGMPFFQASERIWLAGEIAPRFLELEDTPVR